MVFSRVRVPARLQRTLKTKRKMKSKVTKSNYEEVLNKIAAEFDLEKFTSVSSPIGYPEEEYTLLEGLTSEEQANEILDKYPQAMFVEVEWREGWKTKYRRNHLHSPKCYNAEDELDFYNNISGLWHKGDDVREFEVFYLGEGLQYECEELIRDLNNLGLSLDEPMKNYEDCGIDEYTEFCDRADKVIKTAQYNEIANIPDYVFEELEEIQNRVQEVIDMRQELEDLKDGEALIVDNCWQLRVIEEKSMYWNDGDVTHRCIAVGFDPDFLPSEEEIEYEEE